MNPRQAALLVAIGLVAVGSTFAQPKAVPSDEERVARAQQILETTLIDVKSLENKKLTLAELLTHIEKNLPADQKLSVRLDAAGLGKELPRVAGATIKFETNSGFNKTEAVGLLRSAIHQASEQLGLELDNATRPDGIIVSFPRFAIYRLTYDIPKRLGRADATSTELSYLARFVQGRDTDGDSSDFAHALMAPVELRPGETVELINGTRLVVTAAGDRQEQFQDILDQFARLLDLGLVMNARLFEVDRTFFDKIVAPLFPSKDSPAVVRIDGPTFKKFASLKPLAVSDGVRLRRGKDSVFLSRQVSFRSSAGNGVEGVSVSVDPKFSADRRYVRLSMNQQSEQFIAVKKSGTVEKPDVRATSTSGVVQIPDEAPILMRVDYRPVGEGAKDKAWVIVARPFIWMDNEMRERYLGEPQDFRLPNSEPQASRRLTPEEVDRELAKKGVSIASVAREIWDSDLPSPDSESGGVDAPLATDTVKEILQAVVSDVLRNPKLKAARHFYGTPGDELLVLARGDGKGWPAGFLPQTFGYKLVRSKPEPFSNRPRVLGLRLAYFHLTPSEVPDENQPIEVELFNAGGSGNGAVAGSSQLSYSVRRADKKWLVQLTQISDP